MILKPKSLKCFIASLSLELYGSVVQPKLGAIRVILFSFYLKTVDISFYHLKKL